MTDERPGAEQIYREWNPRYVAYAAAHGRGPAAQLAKNNHRTPNDKDNDINNEDWYLNEDDPEADQDYTERKKQ